MTKTSVVVTMKKQFRNFPVEIEAQVDVLCRLDLFGKIWEHLETLDTELSIIKDKRFERSIRKTRYHTATLPEQAMKHFANFINQQAMMGVRMLPATVEPRQPLDATNMKHLSRGLEAQNTHHP